MDSARHRSESSTRLILIAYLAHMLVPIFLLMDVLLAWHLYLADKMVLVACGLWLTIGFGVLFLSRNLKRFPYSKLQGIVITIYSLYLSLLLAELFAQFTTEAANRPALWPPGLHTVFEPDTRSMPGVYGRSTFTVNEIGLRGPPLPRDDDLYRIVAVGGSTTECIDLDDSETWPHLLMEAINAQQRGFSVWIANAGQSGRNTADHLTLLQTLPILSEADMLIFLIGINDLIASLAFEGGPTQEHLKRNSAEFRAIILGGGRSTVTFFRRLQLYQLSRASALALLLRFTPYTIGMAYNELRRERADAPIVPLPDLRTGLEEYRQNVRRLAVECQVRTIRCLFLTQPTMWRKDLTSAEEQLLWFGWVGRKEKKKGYVAVAELARAMDAYNQVLLEVCGQDGLECFDLASSVSRDTSVFFDDTHFNEGGAQIVAQLLRDYLLRGGSAASRRVSS